MSFMRTAGSTLLLAIGIPVLLAGGTLWIVAGHRDAGGAFGGQAERLETAGHAVVVPDLDALLRRDAPFVRVGRTRLRITAQTQTGPAFLGIGPAAEAHSYLASAPHATVERVSVTRGALPVRADVASPSRPGGTLASPGAQTFWRQSGIGVLDLDSRRLRGRALSLVVMRPDAGAGIEVDIRAEVRPGWLDPAMWGLMTVGTLLLLSAVIILTRPVRPRDVVFVVEPGQVPVLAARLGVGTLDPAVDRAAVPGTGPPPTPAHGRGSAERSADLADVLDGERRPTPAVATTNTALPGPLRPAPAAWPPVSRSMAPPPPWPAPVVERIGTRSRPTSPVPASPVPAPAEPLRASSAQTDADPVGPRGTSSAESRVAALVGSRIAGPLLRSSVPVAQGGGTRVAAGRNMGRARWWNPRRGERPAEVADRD